MAPKVKAICPYCNKLVLNLIKVDDGAVACSYDCYESYMDELSRMTTQQFISHLSNDYCEIE